MVLMVRWLRGQRERIDHVVWLVTGGIFHGVGVFSPIYDSCLFEIKVRMFLPCRYCILSLYFLFLFCNNGGGLPTLSYWMYVLFARVISMQCWW